LVSLNTSSEFDPKRGRLLLLSGRFQTLVSLNTSSEFDPKHS
jgi:hypothetical protein